MQLGITLVLRTDRGSIYQYRKLILDSRDVLDKMATLVTRSFCVHDILLCKVFASTDI